jgi:hypothetical protein
MSGPATDNLSNLRLLAEVADRSLDEMIAAEALVTLSETQVNEMASAAEALLDLNNVPVSDEEKHELSEMLKEKPFSLIKKNARTLEQYGIFPPVKFLNDVSGGDTPKRKREETDTILKTGRVSRPTALYNVAPVEKKARVVQRKFVPKLRGPYESIPAKYKNLLDHLCDITGASKFMKGLFPTNVVKTWTETMKRKCRNIYEQTGIETQCRVVLEAKTSRDTAMKQGIETKTCYLCGLGFKDAPGLKPSCEHILPIIQAIFLLDLWRPGQRFTKDEFEVLMLEYDWAHACCNIVKGAKPYLHTIIDKNDPYPRWDFNDEGTRDVFNSILNGTSYEVAGIAYVRQELNNVLQKNNITNETWIEKNTVRIRDLKIRPIIAYINSKGHGGDVAILGFNNCLNPNKLAGDFKELLDKNRKSKQIELPVPGTPSTLRAQSPIEFGSQSQSQLSLGRGRRKTLRRKKGRKSHKTYKWRRLY